MNCTSMRKESRVDALKCLFSNQSCRTLRFEASINSFHLTHCKPNKVENDRHYITKLSMSGKKSIDGCVRHIDWIQICIRLVSRVSCITFSLYWFFIAHPVASHNRSRFSGRYRCGNSKSSTTGSEKNKFSSFFNFRAKN